MNGEDPIGDEFHDPNGDKGNEQAQEEVRPRQPSAEQEPQPCFGFRQIQRQQNTGCCP